MVQVILIGLGAGLAAAMLFASVATGSVVSMVLFYLAPLPIVIAALGWSHWAGLVAAVTSAAGLGLVFSPFFFLAFLIAVGLPAWWLGYLTLLARPGADAAPDQIEWYPPGRLVFWGALLGAAVVAAAIPHFGLDAESFRAELRKGFERVFRLQTGTPPGESLQLPGISDPDTLFDLFVIAIPPIAVAFTTATLLFNLWLAGRVVAMSGRLRRPWPDLTAIALPASAPALLAAALAGMFIPGLAGIVAGFLVASLLVAHAALGLAVVHATTRRLKSRGAVLATVYATIAMFGWPLVIVILLGIVDALFDLRARVPAQGGPPAPRS